MTMWLLFLILIAPSIPGDTMLEQFETYDACQAEAKRITAEFVASYPTDHDYRLDCRFRSG